MTHQKNITKRGTMVFQAVYDSRMLRKKGPREGKSGASSFTEMKTYAPLRHAPMQVTHELCNKSVGREEFLKDFTPTKCPANFSRIHQGGTLVHNRGATVAHIRFWLPRRDQHPILPLAVSMSILPASIPPRSGTDVSRCHLGSVFPVQVSDNFFGSRLHQYPNYLVDKNRRSPQNMRLTSND